MCGYYGVRVKGVILNRVMESKRQMILDYFPKTLKKWNIPLLGCVPYSDLLSHPTVQDFENLFDTTLISGQAHHYRTFDSTRLVAGSLDAFEAEMQPNELVITPASREEIILKVVQAHRDALVKGVDLEGGLILTSTQPPSEFILQQIRSIDIPVLYAPLCSYDAMKIITSFTAKIRTEDLPKIDRAIQLVEENVHFDKLLGSACN